MCLLHPPLRQLQYLLVPRILSYRRRSRSYRSSRRTRSLRQRRSFFWVKARQARTQAATTPKRLALSRTRQNVLVLASSLSISMPPPPAPLPPQQSILAPGTPLPRQAAGSASVPHRDSPCRSALYGTSAIAAADTPVTDTAVKLGAKRSSGTAAGPSGARKRRTGAGGHTTSVRRSSPHLSGVITPIHKDAPRDPQPQGQLLVIREYQLSRVVAAAVAPMRKDTAMTRKDVTEILFSMGVGLMTLVN